MTWGLTGISSWVPLLFFFIGHIFMAHTLYRSRYHWIVCCAAWVLCGCGLYILNSLVSPLFPEFSLSSLCMVSSLLGILVYFFLFPELDKIQSLFTFFFLNNVMYVMVLSARTLVGFFGEHLDGPRADQLFLNVFVIVSSFFLVSFALELKETILKCLVVYRAKMKNLLAFAFSCYSVCVLMTDVWGIWYIPEMLRMFQNLFIIVVTISGYLAVFDSLSSLGDKLMSEAEMKIAKEQLIVSNQYYKELAEHIKKMRIHNHNLRYIVKAVAGLAEKRDVEGIQKFIRHVEEDIPKNAPVWSRVPEIDAVIASCADSCGKEGISFRCEFTLPHKTGIEPLHMCIMLGNSLRNALDACQRMKPEQQKFIYVHCFPAVDKIVICVENSFDGVIRKRRDGSLVSRKEEDPQLHGYGMESIQMTARKYHGNCTWEAEGNLFRLSILLSRP